MRHTIDFANYILSFISRARRFAAVGILVSGNLALLLMPISANAVDTGSSKTAAFIKQLNPYASLGVAHDSNLFRLPDPLPPGLGPRDGLADQYATLAGGFSTDVDFSQQQLAIAGQIYHNSYNTYDELDYTGGNALAVWKWAAGNRLAGNLGYEYDRNLRSFVNRNAISAETARDIRTENALFADADIEFIRDWRLNLRGNWADIEFSETSALDLERFTGGIAVNYLSRAKNILGLDAELTQGKYKKDSTRNFDELDIGPTFDWQFGGRTKIRGKIGYTWREYKDLSRIDYDDFTGRVALVWKNAGGVTVKTTIWRELSNLGDEIATFALVQGIGIEPSWKISTNVTLRLVGEYEDRDFDGEDPTLPQLGLPDRTDTLYSGIIAVDWQILKPLGLSVGYDLQKRNSNREFRDFNARVIQARFTFSL